MPEWLAIEAKAPKAVVTKPVAVPPPPSVVAAPKPPPEPRPLPTPKPPPPPKKPQPVRDPGNPYSLGYERAIWVKDAAGCRVALRWEPMRDEEVPLR